MKAKTHPFEAARLAALRAYDILDTPAEKDFDDIVSLASQICETPISVVNFIDEGRQWFKAETGLGVRETPLETSLCAHVILEDEFVEIPDTQADPRMCDNPLCLTDPGLRFYAGALLKSKDGFPIGTLCVLDNKPRTLTPLQRDTLRILAAQVMTQLDLRAYIAIEKTLRSEIDHRVKNSLQVVGAFVSLEKNATQDKDARSSLDRVAQHVNTVAALHDHLTVAGQSERLDLQSYLDRVVALNDQALPANITIAGDFEPLSVLPREAAILGTIVNELVANAYKHSLSHAPGTISLVGRRLPATGYRLTCTDDAKLLAVAKASSGRVGLGLQILRASVRQLGGTMSADQDDTGYCTRIKLQFAGE
ncbi:MAG: histidine kinase dimerization/phosphoacceptor domain -containing protein [Sphingomicrobium sp.]